MATIALFCKTFVKGGAEKQALTLARLLSEQGLDVIVISWSSGKTDLQNSAYIASNGLKYYELAGNPLKKCIALERIIKKENVALIFAYLTLANFVSGVIRLFNKSVITFGGIRTEKLPYYKFIFERLVHNRLNNATIFNNFSAKSKFIPRGFRSQKVIVIHNAIGLTEERPAQESRDMVNIITVARFVKSKDFPVSLSSFKNLVSENQATPLKYTMIGYGPEEPLIRSLISELELNGKVEIVLNPPNVTEYLQNADIYLSTSLFEGLSNSIMEAMVAGLPIVATDVGDNRYLVKEGVNGNLVPRGSVDQIKDKLELLVRSPELRKSFGQNSRALVAEEFSEDKLTKKYLELIRNYTNLL